MTSQDRHAYPRHNGSITNVMGTMRSMQASMRRHPSYSYEIPEPRSHVKVLDDDPTPIAPVIDLAAARQRRRARTEATR
ncbi:MAG: hypothetical protein V7636_1348 [Actinomycetota bacterium]